MTLLPRRRGERVRVVTARVRQPADTQPELEPARATPALWPRVVRWVKRLGVVAGAAAAVAGGTYAAARIVVAAERSESDQADTAAQVKTISDRLYRIEGALDALLALARKEHLP